MDVGTLPLDVTPTAGAFPPEIVHLILRAAFTNRHSRYVLDGQFTHLETLCKLCAYRSLAKVSFLWETIAKSVFLENVVVGTAEGMEALIQSLTEEPELEWTIRSVDASLRGKEAMEYPHSHAIPIHEVTRAGNVERDRQLLIELVKRCPRLFEFDCDVGFHKSITLHLPSTLRKLVMRNSEALDTMQLVSSLPLLEDLTIRLVLDWNLPADCTLQGTCALRTFELSITGWGETALPTLDSLLAGSTNSLRALTLRNKSAQSITAFLPVAHALIGKFSAQLTGLTIQDAPMRGMRYKDELPLEWFPTPVPACPKLLDLHLCGLSYSAALFTALKCSAIHTLEIEDFDNRDSSTLLSLLALKELQELHFLLLVDHQSWGDEAHANLLKLARGRGITLVGSWSYPRIARDW